MTQECFHDSFRVDYIVPSDTERVVSIAKQMSLYVGVSSSGISTSAHYSGHKQVKG
jgi:hypothetical protein